MNVKVGMLFTLMRVALLRICLEIMDIHLKVHGVMERKIGRLKVG